MSKRLSILYCIAIMVICISCNSKDGVGNNEITPALENSEITSTPDNDVNIDGNEITNQGDNSLISAYDGLPEVTVPTISFEDSPYRTFDEYMEQNPMDDTPYKCVWEKTEDVSDVPDENIILWAAKETHDIYEMSEKAVNAQLKKDGYPFRLKIVSVSNYEKNVQNCDADIIFTGDYYDGDVYPPAYKVVYGEEGKYLQLDQYLEGSSLWNHYPELDWESTEYKGAHYIVPNYALSGETGLMIRIKKSCYTEEELEGFDGTLDTILPLVSWDRRMFYGISEFDWLTFEGIDYLGGGIYLDKNGNIGNVMDLDINIRWMREMNRLLRKEMAIESASAERDADEWAIALTDISDKNRFNEDDYYIYTFPGIANNFYRGALAIRSTTKNPEMAFKLMELIITDHTYANLMAYGGEGWIENEDGYMIDPVTGERKGSGARRYYFGIMDNAGRSDYCRWSFDTPEDRKEYVSKYIKKVEYKNLDYPALLYQYQINVSTKYADMVRTVLNEKKFNQMLAERIAVSREAFKILE